jgi:hypothetical protein
MLRERKYWIKRRLGIWGRRVVWRLPRRLAYWCAIRVIAHATTGEYSNQVVPELTAMDALKRWEKE